MREDKFDEKVRELLNEAQQSYDVSSWSKLSDRMDHDESFSTEEDIFPNIKDKLENHKAPLSEEHWTSLKSDLDYIEERRERLYIVKALEAAIVLLLVYTYFNYQQLNTKVDMDISYIQQVEEESEDPQLISATVSLDETSIIAKSISHNQIRRLVEPAPASIYAVSDPSHEVANSMISRVEKVVNNSMSNRVSQLADAQSVDLSTSITKIDKLTLGEFAIERITPSTPFFTTATPSVKEGQSQTNGWRLGLPFSMDVNFINTDIDLGYLSNQIESGLIGNSFGISMAYRKGDLEIESGIRYSQKTFVPGKLTTFSRRGDDFLKSQLDHMIIKQLQIPLLAKIYAAPYKKSTLYGVAGIAFNTILQNEYVIRTTKQPNAREAEAPNAKVVKRLSDLPKGILESGGTFKENIYITGVLGFGVQSFITDRVSWYIQPQYQHSFTSEINQVVSKVNSLSVEGGFQFSF